MTTQIKSTVKGSEFEEEFGFPPQKIMEQYRQTLKEYITLPSHEFPLSHVNTHPHLDGIFVEKKFVYVKNGKDAVIMKNNVIVKFYDYNIWKLIRPFYHEGVFYLITKQLAFSTLDTFYTNTEDTKDNTHLYTNEYGMGILIGAIHVKGREYVFTMKFESTLYLRVYTINNEEMVFLTKYVFTLSKPCEDACTYQYVNPSTKCVINLDFYKIVDDNLQVCPTYY